jgi:hypothetical protein
MPLQLVIICDGQLTDQKGFTLWESRLPELFEKLKFNVAPATYYENVDKAIWDMIMIPVWSQLPAADKTLRTSLQPNQYM